MIRVGVLAAGFLLALASPLALSADDQALLDRVHLTRVRPMTVYVNTTYGQPLDHEVRFVRVTAEPASKTCSVYLAEIEVFGTDAGGPPLLTALLGVDLDGNGKGEVVIGTDGGDVLAFDLNGNQLWERNVGDRVTSLAPVTLHGKTAVIAASLSSHVWAFDADGKTVWRTTLGEPVRRLIPSGDTLVCAASGAGVAVLSRSGAVLSVAATPAPVIDIVILGQQCVAQLADGSVSGVALKQR